jgi:pyridoxamine 5'-phosphate oxidase
MHWVAAWISDASDKAVKRNPNSMAIVTVGNDAMPSARMVLCKDFQADPGYLVFYTNYQSRKARQISENPNVAVLFHWDQLGRQVRIEGQAARSPDSESDAYFATRDWGSQLGAWGSDQSAPLESRNALLKQVGKRALKLGVNVAKNLQLIVGSDHPAIPRPAHWGGYRVWASSVELWIEGKDRIHDRARWDRSLVRQDDDSFITGAWSGTRLQP